MNDLVDLVWLEINSRGWTVSQFCILSKIPRPTADNFLKRKHPSKPVTQRRIAEVFGWPYDLKEQRVRVEDIKSAPPILNPVKNAARELGRKKNR